MSAMNSGSLNIRYKFLFTNFSRDNKAGRRFQHMSEIVDYIRSAVDSYLLREIGVDKFREAFVGAYVCVRNSAFGDKEAQRLASRLMVSVAEFSAGHRTEASLRLELANAIRPFEGSLHIGDVLPEVEEEPWADSPNFRMTLPIGQEEALWVPC
jgi:hypothetical protein